MQCGFKAALARLLSEIDQNRASIVSSCQPGWGRYGYIMTQVTTSTALTEKRRSERLPTVYNAWLNASDGQQIVELCDVSARGARIIIRRGFVPEAGQEVVLGLMDGRMIEGKVSWVGKQDCGIVFMDELASPEDLSNAETLGADLFRLVARLQPRNS